MLHRLLAFAAFTAAVLCFVPAVPARADDAGAAALLAKHHAFVGWQFGDGSFKTLRLTGKLTNDRGETLYTFSEVRGGLAYRKTYADLKMGGVPTDDGFTGNVFWQSNENGFTTPTFGDAAKAELAFDIVLNEATTSLPGTLRGLAVVDGKPVQIVRVALQGTYALDLYVDPVTGAYAQAVADPDGIAATLHVLSYMDAGAGKKVIGSYRYQRSSSTWSYDKVDANPALTVDDFHPPAPRATWAFGSGAPFPVKITDTRFIVDAKVNGVPGRFIIDTGAAGIFLTRAFAARAHVKQFSSSEASGIGGSAKTDVDRLETLQVGDSTLSNVVAYAQGVQFDDDAPDGAIGFDLFGGAIVNLDTTAQRMTVLDPASAVDAGAGVTLNVDLDNSVPTVPMKMDGTINVNATLDSGNPYYVLFGKELITQHGLKMLVDTSAAGGLQSHPMSGGVGGLEVDKCGHVDSLVLGPVVYQSPPACESPSYSGRDILVGYDFLRHFNYIFDYPHGHLIMIPHKE